MSTKSLSQVVSSKFIEKLQAYTGSSSSRSITNNDASVNVATSLRSGAQLYGTSVQGLNAVISFLNISSSDLKGLEKITDKLITLTERATRAATSDNARRNIERQFDKFATNFEQIVASSKVGDNNLLDKEGLKSIFYAIGLDQDSSTSMAELFNLFKTTDQDTMLASQLIKGKRPVNIPPPASAGYSLREFQEIFDRDRDILSRPKAYQMLTDLKALREQIKSNISVLGRAVELVADNMQLIREAGFALLNLSEEISDSATAEEIAREVRRDIRKNAKGALSQLENLDPLTVAALTFEASNFSLSIEDQES